MKPIAPALLLGVAACASLSPEARLRTGLIEAGLSARQSACMADRMNDKLSLLQLRSLSSLKNLNREKMPTMSTERFLRNVRSLKDPEIVAVTTSAALACAFGG